MHEFQPLMPGPGLQDVVDAEIDDTRVTASFELRKKSKEFEHEISVALCPNEGNEAVTFLRFEFTIDIGTIVCVQPKNIHEDTAVVAKTETSKSVATGEGDISAQVGIQGGGASVGIGGSIHKTKAEENSLQETWSSQEYLLITGSGEDTPKATWMIRKTPKFHNKGLPSHIPLSVRVNARPFWARWHLQVNKIHRYDYVMFNSVCIREKVHSE
jgi:hypothetical protein